VPTGSRPHPAGESHAPELSPSHDATAAVQRLADVVANDFNDLLTTILTSVEMVLDRVGPSDPVRPDAEAIRRAARRGAELTQQLRAISRGPAPVQLRTLIATPPALGAVARTNEKQRTVLLAEDEPTVRLLMKRVLERAGFAVLVATSGEEALEMARAHGGAIDALVTDVIMPGMGGGELSRRLRRDHPELPVLHVSGYTAGTLRHHDVLDASADFLQKPFSPQVFLEKLRLVMEARTG
jgi:CheY-like chemotaxis protein